jgi:competence protein ComK
MDFRTDYLINQKTITFQGVYSQHADLFTKVIEGNNQFVVTMSPLELINKSLLRYGSSFEGAISSSKDQLDNMYHYPIKISQSLDIWIFPTKSYKNHQTIYFVLNHIQGTKAKGVKQSEVSLSYGHIILINMKQSAFNNKRSRAEDLRESVRNNINLSMGIVLEPNKGFYLKEDADENRYTV